MWFTTRIKSGRPSAEALAKCSTENDKIFPKKSTKAGGILRYLLHPILNNINGTAQILLPARDMLFHWSLIMSKWHLLLTLIP